MGLGEFAWQWAALGGLAVFYVATTLTIGKLQKELDKREHFRAVADQLAEFLAEGDRMMTHIASGVASVFMDDVFKWVSRTHALHH
jgi:chromosome segregation and condensation protein ScpB